MSRSDYSPDLATALDGFNVPAPSAGFDARMLAGVTSAAARPATRDRRGAWTLARRAMIGTLAAGMVSAAAVASGLFGAAGIRVPVLTAMLAPRPTAAVGPQAHTKPVRVAMVTKAHRVPLKPEDPGLVDPGSIAPPVEMRPGLGSAMARRTERRMERRPFLAQNPQLRPLVRQAIQNDRAFVEANPDVRTLRALPPAARRAFLKSRPDLKAAVRARQAERRAFIAANPEVGEILRARMERRRAALRPLPVDPALPQASGAADQ